MSARNVALVLIIIVLAMGGLVWQYRNSSWLAPRLGCKPTTGQQQEVSRVSYICDAGKTIAAVYYQGAISSVVANTNVPPVPNGSVALTLSDNRNLTLPQTISGSGIRYANADASIVFWSKGATSFVTEGTNQTQSFANCVAQSNISGQESWHTYASSALGYSVRYPDGYMLNPDYVNQSIGPGKNIKGIQVTIPATVATGTNLSMDSGVSIETVPNATVCSADLFMGDQVGSTSLVTVNGVSYSVGKGSDAGAGNRYDETVYALVDSSPCTAARYFIHSTQLGNYPAGTVKGFDQVSLLQTFDGIRASLLLAR
jgi:membrane-bound inhibitor of C-type lysozyme